MLSIPLPTDRLQQIWDAALAASHPIEVLCSSPSEATSLRHRLYARRVRLRVLLLKKGSSEPLPWDELSIRLEPRSSGTAVCLGRFDEDLEVTPYSGKASFQRP